MACACPCATRLHGASVWDATFAGIFETWGNQIERAFRELNDVKVKHEEGPRGIFDAWRSRLQRLTSITEQLKRRDVRQTLVVVNAALKSPMEKVPTLLAPLLRRWKELDTLLTEGWTRCPRS
ncbi:MAG: hypothetical protein EOO65_05840 [Methanosarcinales archaeon]|nr:MAG: hypothetical protein EOO65_05840 [Methanosarcinales archaeon]